MPFLPQRLICTCVSLMVLFAACDDPTPPRAEVTVPFESLLSAMYQTEQWLEPERFPYRSLQQSSQEDGGAEPGTDRWWANVDKGHFRRMICDHGRDEAVLMEASGSGALMRVWAANPMGTLRVYVDGADDPVIEENMEALLGGQVEPFGEPFAYIASRGYNFYFPIPFERSVMVTVDDGFTFRADVESEGLLYYHVGYRLYDTDVVASFDADTLSSFAAEIQETATRISDNQDVSGLETAEASLSSGLMIEASEEGELIRRLHVATAGQSEADLRNVVLSISFDGEETVRAPLSDFFGSGVGQNTHRSLVTEVDAQGFTVRFPMPFLRSATIRFEGAASLGDSARVSVSHGPYAFGDQTRYFHAGWRGYPKFSAVRQDLHWVTLTGSGLYVGNSVTIGNPTTTWWGEGDERIYVDGDTAGTPSFPGTGTEDYYGYAFTDPSLFTRAYHGQVRSGAPAQRGIISLHRFHVLDAIPYAREFRFEMEYWHWHFWSEASVEVVHYWYAREGADDLENIQAGDVLVPDLDTFNTEM